MSAISTNSAKLTRASGSKHYEGYRKVPKFKPAEVDDGPCGEEIRAYRKAWKAIKGRK